MPEIIGLPAYSDNYVWVLHQGTNAVAVDPGDAVPVKALMKRLGASLTGILLTHHHADHVGGVAELLAQWAVPVYGPAAENIPVVDRPLKAGARVRLPEIGVEFDVIDVGGHTLGHIAYAGAGVLFSGDTLFAGGCGRVFEGTPEQMWASLSRLAALPPQTRVYCAHEYTAGNLRFALAVEPDNDRLRRREQEVMALRQAGRPTVPSDLGLEFDTNPFLRVGVPEVRRAAEQFSGATLANDAAVFAALREWKNVF